MQPSRFIVIGWLVFGLTLALFLMPGAAVAKQWDSEEHNVLVVIPDGSSPWEWLPFEPDWAKIGIIKGAKREPDRLKNKKDPDGEGALMHLAVRDAPKDSSLQGLASDSEVRDFLLKRFRGTESDVETEETTIEADGESSHPALVLRAKGKSLNLMRKDADSEGILVATVARGKLIMMRLYAWPTEYDADGLSSDINFLEGNCLSLITAKEGKDAKKADEGPPPEQKGEGEKKGDEETEDEGKEEVIEHRAQTWRLTKHKRVLMQEISDEEKTDFLVFKAADSDRMGAYAFYIYAPPNSQYIDGVKAPAPDLLKWIGPDWWNHFNNTHPKGELATWEWPRKPVRKGAKTFLTLPLMEDEDNRDVVFKADDKRPIEADASDLIKKYKFVEKVKQNHLGSSGKASEAVRGCMEGRRPTDGFSGPETVFRFAFRHKDHSYRVFVTFSGMAYKKWGEAIRDTLESWEFGIKFRD